MPSHRSSHNIRSHSMAYESNNYITDPDNSATESTASASAHDSEPDSEESGISDSDSDDLQLIGTSKISTVKNSQRTAPKRQNVCAVEVGRL
jgi:hypothetical protein